MREPWCGKLQRCVESLRLLTGGGGRIGRGPDLVRSEFKLHGRHAEEPVGPVQDTKLQQLNLAAVPRAIGHGGQYTHAPMPPRSPLSALVAAHLDRYQAELRAMVGIDCGSYTPVGVNRVADLVAAGLRELGATVERLQHRPAEGEARSGTSSSGAWPAMARGCCSSATWTPSSRRAPQLPDPTVARATVPSAPG